MANPYASGHLHQEAKVYVHQVVREDAELLYGFATERSLLFLNDFSLRYWPSVLAGYYCV